MSIDTEVFRAAVLRDTEPARQHFTKLCASLPHGLGYCYVAAIAQSDTLVAHGHPRLTRTALDRAARLLHEYYRNGGIS